MQIEIEETVTKKAIVDVTEFVEKYREEWEAAGKPNRAAFVRDSIEEHGIELADDIDIVPAGMTFRMSTHEDLPWKVI